MHGEAIFQAVHSSGVFGNVAADGAGDLARWVGRVIQAVRSCRLADCQVSYAGLHDCRAAVGVNSLNFVELCQAQSDAHFVGQRAARQACASTPSHNGYVQRVANTQHRTDLSLRLGQRHYHGALSVGRQSIAFVGRRIFVVPEQGVCGQVLAQGVHHLLLARAAVDARDLGALGGIYGIHVVSLGDATALRVNKVWCRPEGNFSDETHHTLLDDAFQPVGEGGTFPAIHGARAPAQVVGVGAGDLPGEQAHQRAVFHPGRPQFWANQGDA